jgi:hypothetical protein
MLDKKSHINTPSGIEKVAGYYKLTGSTVPEVSEKDASRSLIGCVTIL